MVWVLASKRRRRDPRRGSALIEIIAVLVILGILAASVAGALAALGSLHGLRHPAAGGTAPAPAYTPATATGIGIGDFTGWLANSAGVVTAGHG